MSVPLKTHSVTVYPVTQSLSGSVKQSPLQGVGVTVACYHYPGTAGEHVDAQTGAMLENPEILMCDLPDQSKFAYGYRVIDNDTLLEYAVKAKPRAHRAGGVAAATDHVIVEMELLEFP